MSDTLVDKKKKLKRMELETNIMRLETQLLELDEQKEKLQESIEEQRRRLDAGEY
jgi:hypothetical protein